MECKNEMGEGPKFFAHAEREVKGALYVVRSRNQLSSYYIGQMLKIAYNSENPSDDTNKKG